MIASVFGKTPKISSTAWIAPGASVLGDVTLGEHVSIWFSTVVRGDVNYIRIGDYSNVQDGTVIHVTNGGNPTNIGARVTIGHKAMLHACTVGDDCLIGMGAILLDEVEIGAGSVVAAGALVPPGKKFPPGSLILGSPAKVIRALRAEEQMEMIDRGWRNYFEYVQEYRKTFRSLPLSH
jgi:carbonic anhydrase/acetyltransferase-like protein (isoleucine patch superfamily)